ncbi:MAG: acyl transferase domain-containing protein, partial [Myxococcota bacterium]
MSTDKTSDRLKRAVVAIKTLKARLATLESTQRDPIAVIGMGCRLPGRVAHPEALWELLLAGGDAIEEVPADRWDIDAYYDPDPDTPGKMISRWGGFIDGVDQFDPAIFGISPREAIAMDPQQRLLLETSREALERAGIAPGSLMGTRGGVFVGLCTGDYLIRSRTLEAIDAWLGTGNAHSVASGRLSYCLGLQGPSVSIDTACSSSLVALHLAVHSLRRGECDVALAGGANLILTPEGTISLSRLRALSPIGRCLAFSADADGYVRSEGAAMVALKRLSDAQRDGNPIIAVIRGSAVNQDGRSNGLTAPNGPAQQAVIRAALSAAGVSPAEVGYVEAHGTGTPLGDPIEVQALSAALAPGRALDAPVVIGSLKSNIGHLEGCAGIASFIKAALIVQNGHIPQTLHAAQLNRLIPWAQLPVKVAQTALPWDSPKRIAGVSSFGFSGTNAHVIISSPPEAPESSVSSEDTHNLFCFSATTPENRRRLAGSMATHLAAHPEQSLDSIAFTLADGRDHHSSRLAIVANTRTSLIEALQAHAKNQRGSALTGDTDARRPRVGFLFTGQGSQWPGMASDLYASDPSFASHLTRLSGLCSRHLPSPLLALLVESDDRIHNTLWTQPGLWAFELALAHRLVELGIQAESVVGHSVGEIAAATFAGILSEEDGACLICARSMAMAALPTGGGMLSVVASPEQVRRTLNRDILDDIDLAAHNAPEQSVWAGRKDALQRASEALSEHGLRSVALTVSHAFHSRLMDPAVKGFQQQIQHIQTQKPSIRFFSALTGREHRTIDTQHWVQHFKKPVLFNKTLISMIESVDAIVEVGPQPVLIGLARRAKADAALIPVCRKNRAGTTQILAATAKAYALGADIDWEGLLGKPSVPVALPPYPFQRRRLWLEVDEPHERAARTPDLSGPPLTGQWLSLPDDVLHHAVPLSLEAWPFLQNHVVHGHVVIPGAFWLAVTIAAATARFPRRRIVLRDVTFVQPLILQQPTTLHLSLRPRGEASGVEISTKDAEGNWQRHLTAELVLEPLQAPGWAPLETMQARCQRAHAPEDFYDHLKELGIDLREPWQWITALSDGGGEVLARIDSQNADAQLPVHPIALDNAIAGGLSPVLEAMVGERTRDEPYLPFSIERLEVDGTVQGAVWCHGRLRSESENGVRISDIQLLDDTGRQKIRLAGFVTRRAPSAALTRRHATARLQAITLATISDSPRAPLGKRLGVAGAVPVDLTAQLQDAGVAVVALSAPSDVSDAELDGIVVAFAARETADSVHAATLAALQWTQAAVQHSVPLSWVTHQQTSLLSPEGAAVSALLRSARAEHEDARLQHVTLQTSAPVEVWLDGLRSTEADVVLRNGERSTLSTTSLPAQAPWRGPTGPVLITGGLGGLGLAVAQWLVEQHNAPSVVLAGRRPPSLRASAIVERLKSSGADVRVVLADISTPEGVSAALSAADTPMSGIIHAAGVLDDAAVLTATPEQIQTVLAPKVSGAWSLHEQAGTVDFFVLFSSTSAALGAPGQAVYAAANAAMDALAMRRHAAGQPAVSIAWGPWADVGMAAALPEHERKRAADAGLRPLSTDRALTLLDAALSGDEPVVLAADRRPRRVPARPKVPPDASAGNSLRDRLAAVDEARREQLMAELVTQEAAIAIGIPPAEVPSGTPLQELGLDSLLALELRTALGSLSGLSLASTLVFDYPTVDALSAHLLDSLALSAPVIPVAQHTTHGDEPIAVVGLGLRLPGGVRDPDGLWSLLMSTQHCVSQIPASRWDAEAYYDAQPRTPGRSYVRHGAFLDDIAHFDPDFFGLAP